MTHKSISVAFVCLGNICRSPMAEAVFRNAVKQQGLEDRFDKIDSFGTGDWHKGETPDSRSVSTCRSHSVPIDHRAQQIKPRHFNEFDYVLCMDEMNLRNLRRLRPDGSKARVELFGHWNGTNSKFQAIVDDPYYGGVDGFEHNFRQVSHFSDQFLSSEL
ncbi:probable Low molecular weight phosphotyrosine protein phosphatase [Zygosaccharomyces bailii ISA1307]|nr:probable Low molecular weight phosphotyrosine protein phosphatase [Zygosaccharomyces bailii ISA1307]